MKFSTISLKANAVSYTCTALMASICPAAHGAEVVWSPVDDLAYYERAVDSSARDGSGVFVANLAAAVSLKKYVSAAAEAARAEGGCEHWLALQRIEPYSSNYDFAFYCKRAGSWEAFKGNGLGRLIRRDGLVSDGRVEAIQARVSASEGLFYGPFFDAMTKYVTSYEGGSVKRLALLSTGSLNAPADKGLVVPSRLVEDVELLSNGGGR